MAASSSLYDILGVAQNASADAVRKAYKLKALETHPDKLGLGALEIERQAAEARFREVRTAFEVLGDSAKRRAYDNGLDYLRRQVNINDMQARLARERAEWARQTEARHQERMRVLREEIHASQKRYKDNLAKVELRYQERIRAMEEQLRLNREAERLAEQDFSKSMTFEDEVLNELRRMNPEWEVRRQEVLRVSFYISSTFQSR
ncbi:DnaJ-domain-containing protein [Sparassis latifolia]